MLKFSFNPVSILVSICSKILIDNSYSCLQNSLQRVLSTVSSALHKARGCDEPPPNALSIEHSSFLCSRGPPPAARIHPYSVFVSFSLPPRMNGDYLEFATLQISPVDHSRPGQCHCARRRSTRSIIFELLSRVRIPHSVSFRDRETTFHSNPDYLACCNKITVILEHKY